MTDPSNDGLTTPPRDPDHWFLVIGVLFFILVVACAPAACGVACGLQTRAYEWAAGR